MSNSPVRAAVADALTKYSKDGDFKEPVLRCDSCHKLVLHAELKQHGMCPHCGNTRVRNVRVMNDAEMEQALAWALAGTINADWLELFEQEVPACAS